MEDPTTIAMNLTFFGTLGVAFVMFLCLAAAVVATLVIAGIGRLAAVTVLAFAGAVARASGTASAAFRPAPPASSDSAAAPDSSATSRVPKASKLRAPVASARREPPQLAADWAAAVARADARAAARAEAGPAVRDLPSPTAPVQEIAEVAPLVASATDRKGGLSTVPHAFGKPTAPAAKKPTARDRKAG